MLELGQPMHAFDLGRLTGPVTVRRARRRDSIQLLNGETLAPAADCLLIADAAGPLALAGILGGERAAVTSATRDIFLESALFMPESVHGRAWRYGLHTGSSMRFERGVDPALQHPAMERATALALEICGGQPGPVVEECTPQRLPPRRPLRLRQRWLEQTLGVRIPAAEVRTYLERLEFRVEAATGGWRVTRPDIATTSAWPLTWPGRWRVCTAMIDCRSWPRRCPCHCRRCLPARRPARCAGCAGTCLRTATRRPSPTAS